MELITILKQFLDKFLMVLFFLSILTVFRHIFLFIKHLNNTEPKPYDITLKQVTIFGLALSYIITCLITNITL